MTSTDGMIMKRTQYHLDMNRKMTEIVPELNSKWSLMPMAIGNWRNPEDVLDNGDSCFIPAEIDYELKKDYIWMPQRKDLAAGYYHLRTQESYIEVYDRFRRAKPRRKLRKKSKTEEDQLYDKVNDVLYNRLLTDKPSDLHASRMRLLSVTTKGGKYAAFGKASYLPVLTTVLLLGLGGAGY